MSKPQSSSRREFLSVAAIGCGSLLLGSQALAEGRRARSGGAGGAADPALSWPLVKPGEGMARSVNYVEKHADLKDAKLKTARQGVAWDKQFCNNCMLHSPVNGKKDGKEVAKCTLFANQLVKGEGWCSSWAKKS